MSDLSALYLMRGNRCGPSRFLRCAKAKLELSARGRVLISGEGAMMTQADQYRMKAMVEARLAASIADKTQAEQHRRRRQGLEHLAAYEEWLAGGPTPHGCEQWSSR